jgi:hypothetical protein
LRNSSLGHWSKLLALPLRHATGQHIVLTTCSAYVWQFEGWYRNWNSKIWWHLFACAGISALRVMSVQFHWSRWHHFIIQEYDFYANFVLLHLRLLIRFLSMAVLTEIDS